MTEYNEQEREIIIPCVRLEMENLINNLHLLIFGWIWTILSDSLRIIKWWERTTKMERSAILPNWKAYGEVVGCGDGCKRVRSSHKVGSELSKVCLCKQRELLPTPQFSIIVEFHLNILLYIYLMDTFRKENIIITSLSSMSLLYQLHFICISFSCHGHDRPWVS